MPLRNRVTPFAEIVATPERGTMFGNRGCLHDSSKRLTARRWTMYSWVACVLQFKNRRRALMQPDRYTELFFLDEATSLAAGHRPCGECRREDYRRFMAAFRQGNRMPDADRHQIDRRMQSDRIVTRSHAQITHAAELKDLPDGAMVAEGAAAWLVWNDGLYRWSLRGYGPPAKKKRGIVTVLTPRSTVAALAAGYRPAPHPSLE